MMTSNSRTAWNASRSLARIRGAADLVREGDLFARGGLLQIIDQRPQPHIEIGRHPALNEGRFDGGERLEVKRRAGQQRGVTIRARHLQLLASARVLRAFQDLRHPRDLAHEQAHGAGHVTALTGAAEKPVPAGILRLSLFRPGKRAGRFESRPF